MPNHGYCVNCWWYYPLKNPHYKICEGKLVHCEGNGRCYMHNGDKDKFILVDGSSYCPDYYNRKRSKKTLEDWIKGLKN